jgi:hypothetical protein
MDVFQSLAPFNIHLLRMLKGAHDVFNIVVSNNWEPKHVYNELFEAIDAFGVAMVARLSQLLDKFSLILSFFNFKLSST